jgi:hypothetical protein
MHTPSKIDPVEDDEILCRRIPFLWYDSQKTPPISSVAFTPNKNDDDGISLWRKKHLKTCAAVAATGRVGKEYYVAMLRAGDLKARGIEVVSADDQTGHVSIPILNADDRRTPRVKQLVQQIASDLCIGVEGPFPGQQ